MAATLGTRSALLLSGAMVVTAVVLARRQGGQSTLGIGYMQQQAAGLAYAQPLGLREVHSPERQPASGGPVIRGYIDEDPWNPNQTGGQPLIPHRYGVQHQQTSGLL